MSRMGGRVIRLVLQLVVLAVVGVGVAMAATASTRSSSGTVKAVQSGKYGVVLVSSTGLTLYRFTLDKKGVSTCSGACAKLWPPLLVKGTAKPTAGSGASAGLLGTVMRTNGAAQVTYAGFPLYRYSADTKPDSAKGEGFDSKWFVVSAKGALVKHAVAASSKTATTPAATTPATAWG